MRARRLLLLAPALLLGGCVFAVNTGDTLEDRIGKLEKRILTLEEQRGYQAIPYRGTVVLEGRTIEVRETREEPAPR
ncbi:MAG: hypothetical protein HUU06_04260 [Planctomycetaceae bacterium]|nr:hypothetical protein [Planctomycetota bacterium]NUN51991.1 hypothetical protein [Planctomycetaceae bacterium]